MFKTFLFLIIFSPLAFGTVEPWSYAVMESLAFLVLLVCLARRGRDSGALSSVPGILPLLFFIAYILFQLLPLPSAVVQFLSPGAFLIHEKASVLSNKDTWMTLSIHPKATWEEFFRWSTYVGFYVLTVQLLRNRDMLRKTVVVITIFGAILSFSSILQFYLTKDMALWFRHVPNSMIVGPYICHNHYAGLMEMIFPVILALFFFHRPRTRTASLLKGIIEIISQEKANIHILIGTAALLTVTSIFVSLSRGGILSLCLSLLFFTYMLFKRKISKGNIILILSIILLATASIGWFGWGNIINRFEMLKNAEGGIYEMRLDFWKDSLKIFKTFPVTGSGLGTFVDIYPTRQTVKGDLTVAHAHNDYLELAVEAGIIGFFLAGAFIILLFYKTYRVFLDRKDAYSVYIYMGSITGILSILIHSVTDFNLHIGANGLWFFFLAGLAVSAANTGMRNDSGMTRLPPVKSKWINAAAFITVLVTTAGVFVYHICLLTSGFYFSHIRHYLVSDKTPVEDLQKIERISKYASWFDPFNGEYAFARANAAFYLKEEEIALKEYLRSIRLNPANSVYLKRMGLFFANEGNIDLAERFLEASVFMDVSNAENALGYGVWLLSRQKVQEGVAYFKKAIELNTKMIDNALTSMAIYNVSDEDMKHAVPKISGPAIAFADFLYNSNKKELAEEQYKIALGYIEDQKTISKWQIERIFRFFVKRGNTKEALNVMKRAAVLLPKDAGIRVNMGDLYRDMGISYRAREEYEQALFLDPKNGSAKKRLQSLGTVSR